MNLAKRVFKKRKKVLFSSIATTLSVALIITSIAFLFQEETQVSAAADPSITINLPSESLLGEDFGFSISFENTGTSVGYGPFVDVIFPVNGSDGLFPYLPGDEADGITFNSASYLGSPLPSNAVTELTFPDDGLGTGCVDHPIARDNANLPVQVCGTAGDSLVVLQLPFGSFINGQPTADVSISASMDPNADLSTAMTIQARGGFQFGEDPLDNALTDPSLIDTFSSSLITPTLFSISKSYIGPESETATGPNFPRSYSVTADIADGQTISNFRLVDFLPPTEEFLTINSFSPRTCSIENTPVTPGAQLAPDNDLSILCTSVTGGTGGSDVSMNFSLFVTEDDATLSNVINPDTGDDTTSVNDALAEGTWTPTDIRDAPTLVVSDATSNDHTLTNKSIAVQKSVSVQADNTAVGTVSPGDVLEYVIDFQISDFFTFDDLIISDTISDGQHFDPSFTPTLSVTEHGSTSSGPFDLSNFDVNENYTPISPLPNDGSTSFEFRVSDELVTRTLDSRVLGGCVEQTGTAIIDCSSFNDGAATGQLVFRTIIQESFTDDFPSGDASVDQGDLLSNTVSINGSVLSNLDFSDTGFDEADSSGASIGIERGTISKSIYAINGSTSFSSPVEIAPGDSITYRLEFTLPTSDFENVSFDDFLPLPVFHVDDPDADNIAGPSWTFDGTSPTDVGYTAAAPPAGVAKFGPTDTTYDRTVSVLGTPGIIPNINIDGPLNLLTFEYGDFDDPGSTSSKIDLLFTLNAADDPFADGLLLTNQIRSNEGSTNTTSQVADSIIQFELTQPDILITKGVVASNAENPIYDQVPVASTTFTGPGGSCQRFSGTINSTDLAAIPINSNIDDIDAGDLVTFVIVLENQGSGVNGAFDIQFSDDLPTGFQVPSGGPNVCITDGQGNPLPNTPVNIADTNPLFENGIELIDPSTIQGALTEFDPTSGANLAIITYDLEVSTVVEPDQVIENIADVFNYAGADNGDNHMVQPRTDDATSTILSPSIIKSFVSTNQPHTSTSSLAIGEIATYEIEIIVPEGTMNNFTLVDELDTGLAFVDCLSINASVGLSTSIGVFADACNDPTNPVVTSGGEDVTFDFGNIVNADTNNLVDETITIEYRAIVTNSGANNRNDQRNNLANLNWDQGTISDSSPNLTIVEPTLQVNKTVDTPLGDAGDTAEYTVIISHTGPSNTDAFDLEFEDIIPTDLTYVAASISGSCTAGVSSPLVLDDSGAPTLSATLAELPVGESCTIQYSVTFDSTVFTGQEIDNGADVQWTSLPGDQTTPLSTYNTISTERTGDSTDPGAGTNDYNDNDQATITVFEPEPDKEIVITSETHSTYSTGLNREVVAVGEVIRYRIVSRIAEGVTPNYVLQDLIPNGLTFLNDGTALFGFVSNDQPLSSNTLDGPTLGCTGGANPEIQFTGNETNIASISPECELPDSAVSSSLSSNNDSYSNNTDVYFKLGDITNLDRDADREYVVVEFNAVISNVNSNQAGTNINNSFQAYVNGATVGSASPPNDIESRARVGEPDVSVSKSITTAPIDAGDPIEYEILVTNTATGVNALTAFEINVLDNIPADIENLSLVTANTGAGSITDNSNLAANLIDVDVDFLEPGDQVTLTISGDVINAASVSGTITNTADLEYSSLPGSGTSGNPTGSDTPGASGSVNGERNGDGGVNDYSTSDSAFVTLDTASLSKASISTSEINTTGANVTIGEVVTYEIEVTLPEGSITSLDVIDQVPDGMVFVSGSEIIDTSGFNGTIPAPTITGGSTSGEDIEFSFGAFNVPVDGDNTNNTFTITLELLVLDVSSNNGLPPGQTDLENSATTQVNGGSIETSNVVTVTVVEPEMTISKDFSSTEVAENGSLTVTIEVENTGTSTAFDIELEDPLPAGLLFNGSLSNDSGVVPDTLSESSNIITATYTSLEPGQTSTVSFDVIVEEIFNDGDTIDNTGEILEFSSISGNSSDERTTTNIDDTATVTIVTPDLSVTKTNGVNTLNPGQNTIYDIQIENIGDFDAENVVVTETVPNFTTFNLSNSTSGWVCLPDNSAGSTCEFNISSMNQGDIVNVDFSVDLDVNFPAGIDTIVNSVSVADDGTNGTDPTPGNNLDDDTDNLNAAPDLAIVKNDGITEIDPGGTIIYSLDYENVGSQNTTGVVISETVPNYTTFDPVNSSAGWSCTPDNSSGSTCEIPIGVLNVGDSGSVNFAVTVDVNFPSGVNNILNSTSISDDGNNGPDEDLSNNNDDDTTPLNAAPDLLIMKDDGGLTVDAGDTIVYTINYENIGSQNSTGVSITDTVPSNTTFNPAQSSAGWSCAPDNSAGSTCTFLIGGLIVGASGSIDFAVDVDSVFPGGVNEVTNTTTITDDGTNGSDEDPSNNDSTDDTPVIAGPDLQVTIDDLGIEVYNGEQIPYNIFYGNVGNQTSTNVILTIDVPTNTDADLGASTVGWNCTPDTSAGSTCTYSVGTLNPTDSGSALFVVTLRNDTPETELSVNSQVTISDDGASGTDLNPVDNTDTENTPIRREVDLAITKTNNRDIIEPSDIVIYQLEIENLGNTTSSNTLIIETIPENSEFYLADSDSGWECFYPDPGDPFCEFDYGDLAPGATDTITFAIRINATVPVYTEFLTNTASINYDESFGPDFDPSNNEDTHQDPLEGEIDLLVYKVADRESYTFGESIIYEVVYANIGNEAAGGVVVTEYIPEHTTFNPDLSTSGWICSPDYSSGSICAYPAGTVNGGNDGGSATFAIDIDSDYSTPFNQIDNTVEVSYEFDNDINLENNVFNLISPILYTNVFDPPMGKKTFNDQGLPELEWRMVWINDGNTTALDVVITDPVPADSEYVPGSFTCEPRGISTTTTCIFDAPNNQVLWEGSIGPDPGGTDEDNTVNEVILTYRITVPEEINRLENQACAFWDDNVNGSIDDDVLAGQIASCSDDPTTNPDGDITIWERAEEELIEELLPTGFNITYIFAGIFGIILIALGVFNSERLGHGVRKLFDKVKRK